MCRALDEALAAVRHVEVKFILEDPEALTTQRTGEVVTRAAKGERLLEVALRAGVLIEHACGGACACSTCHVHVESGSDSLSTADDAEEDRVEEAPGFSLTSRLSCQAEITGDGPIVVRVPSWNRNAVKETPH